MTGPYPDPHLEAPTQHHGPAAGQGPPVAGTVTLRSGRAAVHRRWRAFVALGEIALAVPAVLLAVWCWGRGMVVVDYSTPGLPAAETTRYLGNWMTTAVALGTLAGLLAMDAVRHAVVGMRANPRRAR